MYCSKLKDWKYSRKTISQWHLCGLLKGKCLICHVKEIQRYQPLKNMTQALNRSYSVSSDTYMMQCRDWAFSICYIYTCYLIKHDQIPFCRSWLCLLFFTVSKDRGTLTGGGIQVGRDSRMCHDVLLTVISVSQVPPKLPLLQAEKVRYLNTPSWDQCP